MNKLKNNYPSLVRKLTTTCNGWIIGSACYKKNPRDYDIFIPLPFWSIACKIIPKEAVVNTLGGFKCISDNKEIDIWTCEMYELFTSNFFKQAYHPQSGIKLKRYK